MRLKIIEKAKQIYRKYGFDDLDFIADKLGAEIFETDLLNDSEVKEVYFPDLETIAIASNLHPCERKCLIAHGLGHHLFHNDNKKGYIRLHEEGLFGSKVLGEAEIDRKEREADLFATYLLIPGEKLNKILKQEWFKESLNPIPELAEEFQVSPNFMKKRLEFRFKGYLGEGNE
jgi:Zn-dependent peptidase ImmA (M78 family)